MVGDLCRTSCAATLNRKVAILSVPILQILKLKIKTKLLIIQSKYCSLKEFLAKSRAEKLRFQANFTEINLM